VIFAIIHFGIFVTYVISVIVIVMCEMYALETALMVVEFLDIHLDITAEGAVEEVEIAMYKIAIVVEKIVEVIEIVVVLLDQIVFVTHQIVQIALTDEVIGTVVEGIVTLEEGELDLVISGNKGVTVTMAMVVDLPMMLLPSK